MSTVVQSIIKSFEIIRHDDITQKFGIVKLAIHDNIPISESPHYFIFTIDCSGSMVDDDKINIIKSTLDNIVKIFSTLEKTPIIITVVAFNTNAFTILYNYVIQYNYQDLQAIQNMWNDFEIDGFTNIEAALIETKYNITEYCKQNPTTDITHIFLTDGEITEGNDNFIELAKLIPVNVRNIFFGYGAAHNSTLLSYFANYCSGQYYFIDNVTKTGAIYGEVIHNILYRALIDCELTVSCCDNFTDGSCKLYNYKTNSWDSTIKVGDLSSGQVKTWHINSADYVTLKIQLTTKNKHITPIYSNNANFANLLPYIYRQNVQEFMYMAIFSNNLDRQTLIDNIEKLSNVLTVYKNTILQDLPTHNFIQNLCDDLYIIMSTLNSRKYGHMFGLSRMLSQGEQRSYSVVKLADDQKWTQSEFITVNNTKKRSVNFRPVTGHQVFPQNPPLLISNTPYRSQRLDELIAKCSIY